MNKERLHPYNLTPVQYFLLQDPPARLCFSLYLQEQQYMDAFFWDKILFTDKTMFTNSGWSLQMTKQPIVGF